MRSLEEEVRRHRRSNELPKEVCDRIDEKYTRHHEMYGVRLDPLAYTLKEEPRLYEQIDHLPELQRFFRPHVVIAISMATFDEVVWCSVHQPTKDQRIASEPFGWVRTVRYVDRLLMNNPLTNKTESWARPSSDSRTYTVHWLGRRRAGKSYFLGNYDFIKPLEHAVLNHGVGILFQSEKMKLYANFERPIGKSEQGAELSHMCLEIVRKRRTPLVSTSGQKRQTGYYISVHGYPIDIGGLERDLTGVPMTWRDIPQVENPS